MLSPHAKQNQIELEDKTHELTQDFWRAMEEVRGHSFPFVRFKKQDGARLLTLKGWALHYHLSFVEVVRTLIEYWDKKVQHRKTKFRGITWIGVSLATLTGPVSSAVLDEYVLARYPNNEQVMAWKEAAKREQLGQKISSLPSSPQAMVREYREQISLAREKRTFGAASGSKFMRRRYRNNPWY